MKKRVLVSDSLASEGIDVLKENDAIEAIYNPGLSRDELLKEIRDVHGLIVRSATKVTGEVLDAAANLQVIARAGVGLDNIDVQKATEKGVVVMNTPGGNTISTAEQTLALMFAIARLTPMADCSMKQQKWDKKQFEGTELRGKTIAVIGLGRIGMEVARRCKGLSMRVIGYDPYISGEKLSEHDIEIMDLEDIWGEADFITVHTPLTDKTRNIVNKEVIGKMKPAVRVINCARGGLYNEQDLYEALKEKRIAGAALDVFTEEPPRTLPPFHELDNVVLTPHLGASTEEAQISVAIEAAQIVIEYLMTGVARNSVNFPSLDMHELAFLRPYINLAEQMGAFQGSILNGNVDTVSIFYSGDFENYNLSPLTSAYIKGLISPYTEIDVNFVNASLVARERGIKVQTGEDTSPQNYSHLVKITASGKEGTNELWGTVLGKQLWFVRYDEYSIDFVPRSGMLVIRNNDVPNVIGSIGTFLGKNGINIANFHLARTERGGRALMIVDIDDEIDDALFKQLSDLPEILEVKYMKMES